MISNIFKQNLKITRHTIGAKGFNLLQERLRCKGRQIYIGVLNPTYLPRCLTNFQDFFQLFQFFRDEPPSDYHRFIGSIIVLSKTTHQETLILPSS